MGKREDCKKKEFLTTDTGADVSGDDSSLTVGKRGPVLLQDHHLIEKLAKFDRERIPERVVHAKGSGAHGYFKLSKDMCKFTKAKLFMEVDVEVPTFVRFSTVVGFKGSADTLRDPRGFAVKFYSCEGNYDIPGNNMPVFFIRDAIKFPDMVHAFKPSPKTNLADNNRFFDFISSSPESMHMIMFLFSDLGTVKSFRTMEGFGVNTYVWVNNNGDRFNVKYHWKPKAGVKTIDRIEAERLAGSNPDVSRQDLYDCLNSGKEVEYSLHVQLMDAKEEDTFDFDPLDATKTWPEDRFPLVKIGKLILNRAPDNFFEEVEQVGFSPSNLIPGVEASADKLLQGRLFSYRDTQRHRIGNNFDQLPINRPRSSVNNYQQDGPMDYAHTTSDTNYKPNSLADNRPHISPNAKESSVKLCGMTQRSVIDKADDFTQAREKYESYSKEEKMALIDNLSYALKDVDCEIFDKMIVLLCKISNKLGTTVKELTMKYKD